MEQHGTRFINLLHSTATGYTSIIRNKNDGKGTELAKQRSKAQQYRHASHKASRA